MSGADIVLVVGVVGGLLLAIGAGVPVAFCLAGAGAVGLYFARGMDLTIATLASAPFEATYSFSLVVIPMYIFMGILAVYGGVAADVYEVARRMSKRLPGGVPGATIAACAGFAAVSGSSIATASTIGRVAIKEMRTSGYSARAASGLVAAAGTLGSLIPPSVVLVLFAITTQESVGRLLAAGFIPGIVSALIYAVYAMSRRPTEAEAAEVAEMKAVEARQPLVAVRVASAASELAEAPTDEEADVLVQPDETSTGALGPYAGLLRAAALFLIVVGGTYSGLLTATEAGGLGAFAALVMVLLRSTSKGGTWLRNALGNGMREAASTTSMALLLVVGAAVFTQFLVFMRVPDSLTRWIVGIDAPKAVIVIGILVLLGILGCFLDPYSILLVTMPLAFPIVTDLGYDGVWFGIIVVKMIEIGLITPPLGLNCYVVAGASGIEPTTVFRGVVPYLGLDILTIAVLWLFPDIVTFLPNALGL